ncbi:MAG: hypothetical protein ACFE96_15005 [Candidatus Hermodarchaeota archaeon]
MQIDPKVKSLVIFNAGGGIVEREIKLMVQQGLNEFQIQNVPASFDPNTADIKLEFLNPEDKKEIKLQQTIVSLPDLKNVQQIIDREKSAANSIISYSIDFTRELREEVSSICEASSYRTYSDMNGTFNFIIDSSKEGEVVVKVLYFVSDIRLKWDTTLQVNISDDGKTAEIEGFIVVDNQTGFTYENVELGFAIFELPKPSTIVDYQEINAPEQMSQNMMNELQSLRAVRKVPMKRTQRFKQLL